VTTALLKKGSFKILDDLACDMSRVMLVELKDMNLANFVDTTPFFSDGGEAVKELLEWFGVPDDNVIMAHCHWSRGNKRQLRGTGMTAYHPFIVRVNGQTRIWAFAIPNELSRNWLIGTYLGYPQCCVAEYEEDLKVSATDGLSPLEEKRKHLEEHAPNHTAGEVPCWQCIRDVFSDPSRTGNRLIQISTRSQETFWNDSNEAFLAFFDAVNAYLGHRLSPWTPEGHTVSEANESLRVKDETTAA